MIKPDLSLDELNKSCKNTLSEALGIVFTGIGKDYLVAQMPVNTKTIQPMGLLHGGASAALAETVGSMAAWCTLDQSKYYCVGVEIKCNHVRAKKSGVVTATAKALHAGRKIQLWEINIIDEAEKLICFSTLTMAVLPVK